MHQKRQEKIVMSLIKNSFYYARQNWVPKITYFWIPDTDLDISFSFIEICKKLDKNIPKNKYNLLKIYVIKHQKL